MWIKFYLCVDHEKVKGTSQNDVIEMISHGINAMSQMIHKSRFIQHFTDLQMTFHDKCTHEVLCIFTNDKVCICK